MSEEDQPPLRPVVGFGAAIVDEAVTLELVAAETVEQLLLEEGRIERFVLTPEGAIEVGRALIERGERALRRGTLN